MSDQEVGHLQAEVQQLRRDLERNSADTRRMLDILENVKGVRGLFLGLVTVAGMVAAAITGLLAAWKAMQP